MKQLMSLLLSIVLIAGVIPGVSAQEGEEAKGIDDICGEELLAINVVESTLPDEQVEALNTLLRGTVTTDPVGNLDFATLLFNKPAPGAILLVESPDGRYYAAIGAGDVAACVPLAPDAHIQIGSNTKTMTAAIIYQLQEEGLLSTSDLVSEWLPDEIAKFPSSEQITIDMLLTHTSGLFDYLSEEPGELGDLLSNDPDVLGREFSPQELVQMAADAGKQEFAPGESGKWSYSNTGYIMLGLIIEAATGQPLPEVFQERVFTPLGLEDTYFGLGLPDDDRLPQGYLTSPFDYNTRSWNMSQAWAAGAVVSTAEDTAAYVKALFSGELFQDEATLAAMLAPASPDYPGHNDRFYYGHGMNFKDGFLGHGGQTLGFETDMGYNPELDATVVLFTNSAEDIASQGVFFVGEALGWTDWQPFLDGFIAAQLADAGGEILSVPDIVGMELTALSRFNAAENQYAEIKDSQNYKLTFGEDGQLAIRADCNNVAGSYEVGEYNALTIELGVTTLAACGPDSFDQTYLSMLADTASVSISLFGEQISVTLLTSDNSSLTLNGTR